jgi:hypothetical protein
MHSLVPRTTILRLWTAHCLSFLALGIVVQLGCGTKESDPGQAQRAASVTSEASGIVDNEGVNAEAPSQDVSKPSNSRETADASNIEAVTSPTNAATLEAALLLSETVHEGTEAELHHIADWLTPGNTVARHVIEHLASDRFYCAKLRPEGLEVVFSDESIEIRRPPSQSRGETVNTADRFQGKSGLVDALSGLREALADSTAGHAKFKTIRVDVKPAAATTVSYFELAGHGGNDAVEMHSTWTCEWTQRGATWILENIQMRDYEEARSRNVAGPMFADCTESALSKNPSYGEKLLWGIDHWLARIDKVYGGLPGGWCGIAVGDVNGDDLDDFYLSHPGGLGSQLFVQQPDGTFEDTSHRANVDWLDDSHMSLLIDLDNDSDQDLVLCTGLGLIFMENDGTGIFKERGNKLTPEARSVAISAADYDNDGDLDIYVCCYSLRGNAASRGYGILGRPIPYHDANNGGRNILFRNDGDWKFIDVTKRVGLEQNNRRFSLAASWEDFDNDGDVDLYVANDFGRDNLYRNDGGQFTDIAHQAGAEDIGAGMSVSWADYNHDGWMDLYVANMFSSAGSRVTTQQRFQETIDQQTRAEFQHHARGNTLYTNQGNGTFVDDSVVANVTMGRWAWASTWVDINNDTREDLVVANGYLTRADPGDL